MAVHEHSLQTSASPESVWKVWSDTSTWPEWNPDVRAISLNGPFESSVTGSMTTGQGTHEIRLENVVAGRSFDLVTKPIPATTFRFHCEVAPSSLGSRLSQGVRISGGLAPVISALMGKRIAESFNPLLAGLARKAEESGR